MDGRGKRWRIGEVQGQEVLGFCPKGDACDGDVRHFVHRSRAYDLEPQEPVAVRVGNELGDEHIGIRIVMGFVIGDAQGGNDLETSRFGLLLRKACAGSIQVGGQLHHSCPQAARIRRLLSAQGKSQRPARYIGGGAHGRPLGTTRDTVLYQSAVAHRVDVRQVGALVFIGKDAAPVHLQPCVRQELRGRADACRQDDHLRGQRSCAGLHAGNPVRTGDFLESRAGEDAHAACLEPAPDVVRHVKVEDIGHELGGHVHHGDGKAFRHEVLGHLQADEAAAHYYGALAVLLFRIFSAADGVLRRAHGEHAGKLCALHWGDGAFCSYGDDESVVADCFYCLRSGTIGSRPGFQGIGAFCPGLRLLRSRALCRRRIRSDGDRFRGGVYRHRFASGMYCGAGESHELGRGVHDELPFRLDGSADVVGEPAPGVGDVLSFGVDNDFVLRVLPLQLRGYLCSGGYAADDDNLHLNLPPSIYVLLFSF